MNAGSFAWLERCKVSQKPVKLTTMISDEMARMLHDRATRGIALSADEQAELDHWYSQQDECETDMLTRAAPAGDLFRLRKDVDGALAQLQGVTHRVKALVGENETIKREIAVLQAQLKKNVQPA
jgi:hypothetical protein